MGADSKIEWTDHSWNPWTGCQAVSPACDHCYAEAQAKRAPRTFGSWLPGGQRKRTSEGYWRQPLRWNRNAAAMASAWQAGVAEVGQGNEAALIERGFIKPRRPRVFCASMADIMDKAAPIEWFVDALDVMRITPHLIWLLLTKRPQLILRRLNEALKHLSQGRDRGDLLEWIAGWEHGQAPVNIWLGTTVENREEMLRRSAWLNAAPAARRFWSAEPLLGDLGKIPTAILPDWIIAGGESGPKARSSHPDWFRSLRAQCAEAGVPFFMKQMGGQRKPFSPIPDDLMIRESPHA